MKIICQLRLTSVSSTASITHVSEMGELGLRPVVLELMLIIIRLLCFIPY